MITIISIILSIIVIILIAYNFWVKQVTYLITYAIDIEGKRQVDSCEYTISARHGIPSSNEFKDYIRTLLIETNNLNIIDVHRLT